MFSNAENTVNGLPKIDKLVQKIKIDMPLRKNEFTKRKVSLFNILDDEIIMDKIYNIAKTLFIDASNNYITDTGKTRNSLLKNRTFDKDYLLPLLERSNLFIGE